MDSKHKKALAALGLNAAIALAGVVVTYNWSDLLSPQYALLIGTVLVPVLNGWLHSLHLKGDEGDDDAQ